MSLRWPVARVVYDDAMRLLREERARYDKLLEVVLAMKPSGATVVMKDGHGTAVTGPPRVADPRAERVAKAIDASRHSRKPWVRRRLESYADEALASGMDIEELEGRLRTWDKVTTADAKDDDDDTIALVM